MTPDDTGARRASAGLPGSALSHSALGKCCYGGAKTKKDCASCSAWKVLETSTCANSQTEPDA